MSTRLYWEPKERKKEALSYEFKLAIQKRCPIEDLTLDKNDIDYLQGLRDAGVEDAQDLIDAIEKHGAISITEES